MNWDNNAINANVTQDQLDAEQKEQDEGKVIWQQLQDGQIKCADLTDNQYDKLGEYFMGQSAGSTQNHVLQDERIKQMMGENGETQMHINWGKSGSGCLKGGATSMMGLGYYPSMTNFGNSSSGVFGTLIWLVVLIDLVLVGIWLFKQIKK